MITCKHTVSTVVLGLVLAVTICASTQATTYQGGTAEDRDMARAVVESCPLPPWFLERYLGEVTIDLDYGPGGVATRCHIRSWPLPKTLAHEWCHQIWYAMSPHWQEKWSWFCGGDHYRDVAENFAECMRCALWPEIEPGPRTELRIIAPDRARAFLYRWVWSRQTVLYR